MCYQDLERHFLRFRDHADYAAFARFHGLAAPWLARMARRLGVSAVEDVLQDTFVLVIRHRGSWDPNRPLRPWLVAILRNELRRAACERRRRRTAPLVDDPVGEEADGMSVAMRGERRRSLFAALQGLSPAQQRLAWLHLQSDGDVGAIARQLGCREASVRSQMARVRARLATLLPPTLAVWILTRTATARGGAAGRSRRWVSAAALAASLAVLPLLMVELATDAEPEAARALATVAVEAPAAKHVVEPVVRHEVVLPRSPTTSGGEPSWGVLVHDRRGQPVAGVALRVRPTVGPDPKLREQWLVTGDDGIARGEPQVGEVVVLVDRAGTAKVPGVAADRPHRVLLPSGHALRGRVVRDGVPVAGAIVWLSHQEDDTEGMDVARSDPDGRFHLQRVSGRRFVSARTESSYSRLVESSGRAGEEVEVVIPLVFAGATLRGRVTTPDGTPAGNALVIAGDAPFGRFGNVVAPVWGKCDALGRFCLVGVGTGQVPLTARAAGLAPATQRVLLAASDIGNCDLTLTVGATIEGVVLDSVGRPVPGAWVGPLHGWQFGVLGTATASDGTFVVRGLPRRCSLWVDGGDHGAAACSWSDLQSGDVRTWSVVLTGPRVSLPVALTGPDEIPLPGWSIDAYSVLLRAGDPGHRRCGTTDAGGRVHLTGCAAGGWFLLVRPPGSPFSAGETLPVQSGGPPVAVRVDPALWSCTVRGSVVGRTVHGSTQVALWRTDRLERTILPLAADGSFVAEGLPPGRYRVTVDTDGEQVHSHEDVVLDRPFGSVCVTIDAGRR